MRLLFIYFYKDFASFEKGTLIHFSKKYKFTLDKEKSTEDTFYFNKKENTNFIEDFYSKNTDIGVLIGENGTGKSILLNSIRDKQNDYSFCVYEENSKLYAIENNLNQIEIQNEWKKYNHSHDINKDFEVYIDNNFIEFKRKFKSIFYSSILEKTLKNINDEFDISNSKLLSEINEIELNDKLFELESQDILKSKSLDYKIKSKISKIFFTNVKEHLKISYIEFFNETIRICKEDAKYEEIDEIFNLLPNYIINDIITHELEYDNLFLEELSKKPSKVEQYIGEYKSSFDEFLFKEGKNKKEIIDDLNTKFNFVRDKLLTNDFFNQFNLIIENLNSKTLKENLKAIQKLFKIKFTLYKSYSPKHYLEKIEVYYRIEKGLDEVLILFKRNSEDIKIVKEFLNLFKMYYIRQEFGYKNKILIDFYKMGYFEDILMLDKKQIHHNLSRDKSEQLVNYKSNTIEDIKVIVDKNYDLFENIISSKIENLSFETFRLYLIYKVDKLLGNKKEKNHIHSKATYLYITRLIKLEKIQEEEYKELLDICRNEKTDIIFKFLHLFNKYTESFLDLTSDETLDFDTYKNFIAGSVSPFCFEFKKPLSSGEKARVIFKSRINYAMEQIKKENSDDNILLLLDEPDLKLHLEWQRSFLNNLLDLLKSYKENNIYILYATHSPMILSDITSDRVVFLKKDEDSSFSNDIQDFDENNKLNIKNTFGANIYDIYSDSFFLDNHVMGKFAETKISKLINIIEKYKDKNKKLSVKRSLEFLKIANHIGEPLLKNKLIDDIKSLSEEKNEIDIIVEELKGKSFDEIKTRLSKYSNSMQKDILEKLFGS